MDKKKGRNRRKQSAQTESSKRSSRTRLLGIVGIAVAAVVILIVVQQLNQPTGANREGLASASTKSLGPEDAPVLVTDYSDFQ